MPNKYLIKKNWDVPKQKYQVTNWPEYHAALKRCNDITVWLSEDAVSNWYEKDRVYDGTGKHRASWHKLNLAVNEEHYIEECTLTDRFCHDRSQVDSLLKEISEPINHFTADGAYDATPVYDCVITHSPDCEVVIPPSATAILNDNAAKQRNRNI